jgi:hypothetical protein
MKGMINTDVTDKRCGLFEGGFGFYFLREGTTVKSD